MNTSTTTRFSRKQRNVSKSNSDNGLVEFIRVLPQFILPQHFLTGIVYKLTRIESIFWKNSLIRFFIRLFDVDMHTAIRQKPEEFKHFNDFFTRELINDARPIADSTIVSPVDGFISQFGKIHDNQLIQAKGHQYSLLDLLAGDKESAQHYADGEFSTLYLSPRNYHRIHMPIDGRLLKMTFVPGKLFAVNQHTSHVVKNLFARNERLIMHFDTELGPMALIMVGAIFVGSMETTWQGQITPDTDRSKRNWDYSKEGKQIALNKGEEIGRFNMGSTVILLFPEQSIQWQASLSQTQEIVMGQALAKEKIKLPVQN